MTDLEHLNNLTAKLADGSIPVPSNPGPQDPAEAFRLTMAEWRGSSLNAIINLNKDIERLRFDIKDLGNKMDTKFTGLGDRIDKRFADVNDRFSKIWDKVHDIDVRVGGIAVVISMAVAVAVRFVGG